MCSFSREKSKEVRFNISYERTTDSNKIRTTDSNKIRFINLGRKKSNSQTGGGGSRYFFFFRGGGGHMVYKGKRRGYELSPTEFKGGTVEN